MKRNAFYVFLIIEALVCVLLYAMKPTSSISFLSVAAFPFEQIGIMLRWLSETGILGNTIAIVIYVCLCMLPVLYLLLVRRKRGHFPEDILLALLSLLLFVVMYRMINPASFHINLAGFFSQEMLLPMSGFIIYSVLFTYIFLRVLRRCYSTNIEKLQKYLVALLYALNALFVFIAAGICFGNFLTSIQTLKAGNVGNEQGLGLTYVFLFFQYVVNALPYVLSVFVVFSVLSLLYEMRQDRYSGETVIAADNLSRLCGTVLAVTVLSGMTYNLIQFIFAKWLSVINSNIEIPLQSIVFLLAILFVTQIIRDNKKLKDDNNMFI